MTEFVNINIEEIIPSIEEIIQGQGIPKGFVVKDNIKNLIDKSLNIFLSEVEPSCIIKEVPQKDFEDIFNGDNNNEDEAPLKIIYPQADHLILFAVTMGSVISHRISELFSKNDFALASMLDTVTSLAADKSVELLEKCQTKNLIENKIAKNNIMVLSYSPGYCGWHINAQKKLFTYLHPEQIGISLNESCLMTPMKSISGVLIAGSRNIHDFDNTFSFCYNCKAQSCIERRERIFSH